MKCFSDIFSTPMGEFSVAVNADGAVVATSFGNEDALHEHLDGVDLVHAPKAVAAAKREIMEFFAGRRQEFTVKLAPTGTEFQHRVWKALSRIPFGETRSYGQLAAETGNPKASRAVGRANATNPICLIVPCHRCIGADGSLTGFYYGEAMKRRLLEHEGVYEKDAALL